MNSHWDERRKCPKGGGGGGGGYICLPHSEQNRVWLVEHFTVHACEQSLCMTPAGVKYLYV